MGPTLFMNWDSHGALVPHTIYPKQGRSPWSYFFPKKDMSLATKRRGVIGYPSGYKRHKATRFFRRRPYRTFRSSKPRGKGYVRKYNKKAFRGRPRLTASK